MIHAKRLVPLAGVALSGALAMGCFVEVEKARAPRPVDTGTLTVQWTVSGRSDRRACSVYGRGGTDFELLLYQGDEQVLERSTPCEDFQMSVDLPTGGYTGYTTLIDQNSRALTSTLPLKDIAVVRNTELTIKVDFPAGSFL